MYSQGHGPKDSHLFPESPARGHMMQKQYTIYCIFKCVIEAGRGQNVLNKFLNLESGTDSAALKQSSLGTDRV